MRRKWFYLAVLAVVLVLAASIGNTLAYFSDYVRDEEAFPVQIDNTTTIDEEFDGSGNKIVTITNLGDAPVFVRFKAEATEGITLSASGTGWTQTSPAGMDDGYLYYGNELGKGESSSALTVLVTLPAFSSEEAAKRAGEEAHVAVLYESVPALYDTDGNPDLKTAWERGKVTVVG